PVAGNQIARRVFDDLVDFSWETSVARVDDLNDCIARAQEQTEIKKEHVRVMEAEDNDG
nr:hypothetical protein [Tanacetum cinerariifolium]